MNEWKKNSKLNARQLDAIADFVASFAEIPAGTTPDEWLSSPGVAKHPGLEPFQKECGTCHAIDGFTDGGMRDATGLFAWGSPAWIARMIRKPGAADRYGFLGEKQKMPAFGPEQVSDNDVNMIIRYLRGDYPRPAAASNPGPGSPASALRSRRRRNDRGLRGGRRTNSAQLAARLAVPGRPGSRSGSRTWVSEGVSGRSDAHSSSRSAGRDKRREKAGFPGFSLNSGVAIGRLYEPRPPRRGD